MQLPPSTMEIKDSEHNLLDDSVWWKYEEFLCEDVQTAGTRVAHSPSCLVPVLAPGNHKHQRELGCRAFQLQETGRASRENSSRAQFSFREGRNLPCSEKSEEPSF